MINTEQTDLFQDQTVPDPIKSNGTIHIGTSGYIFKDWQGAFYPSKLPQQKWLEYYAQHFTTVEINATYYRLLPASSFESMIRRTHDNFHFWIKLPGAVTHSQDDFKPVGEAFRESIKPLIDNKRLVGLLAQFPYSFKNNADNLKRLKRIHDFFYPVPVAIEFRSSCWYTDSVLRLLEIRDLIFTAVDLPEISGLPDSRMVVTGNTGYIRFHGRNKDTWYNPDAGDRYDYDYPEEELRSWLERIKQMDEKAPISFMFFNNCHAGQAVKNAKMMQKILSQELNLEAPF